MQWGSAIKKAKRVLAYSRELELAKCGTKRLRKKRNTAAGMAWAVMAWVTYLGRRKRGAK